MVVLECFMVAFGWLFASYTGTGQGFVDPGLPAGLVGGTLSLADSIGLLSKAPAGGGWQVLPDLR
jgi:hypothetical protein